MSNSESKISIVVGILGTLLNTILKRKLNKMETPEQRDYEDSSSS